MADNDETSETALEERLNCEKKRSEDYLNKLKYLQADLENLKKRFDREAEQIRLYGTERLVTQLLDIVDELELAVKAGESSSSTQKPLLDGVKMTLKKLRKVLEQEGVSPIEDVVGKTFDPACHNAVATVERDVVAPCTIVEEIRKGYMMKCKLIRPSIVKVAVKPSQPSQSNKTEEKNSE